MSKDSDLTTLERKKKVHELFGGERRKSKAFLDEIRSDIEYKLLCHEQYIKRSARYGEISTKRYG